MSLKSVAGVDSVEVSLEKGLAIVKLKPGNTATLKQLNDAIAKNGFTMKDSTATVAGTVAIADGNVSLRVSGSNDLLHLVPQTGVAANANSMDGRTVAVSGVIPEAAKGRAPDSIRYQSLTEEKQK